MPTRADRITEKNDNKRKKAAVATNENTGLLAALKATRTHIAHEKNVPAYIVFSNAALADMAAKAPRTMSEFLDVSGVGEVKAAQYGDEFLKVITAFLQVNKES